MAIYSKSSRSCLELGGLAIALLADSWLQPQVSRAKPSAPMELLQIQAKPAIMHRGSLWVPS
jgi:hypothetical protein